MMRHELGRKGMALLATALLVIGSTGVIGAEDAIAFLAGGQKKVMTGTIKKDELHEVVLATEGTELKKKRADVLGVKYGLAPKQFYEVKGFLEIGDLENADKYLDYTLKKAKSSSDYKVKGRMFMQHWLLQKAELEMRKGNFKIAAKAYSNIISAMPNSAWYFQARLGEAEAYMKGGNSAAALEKYSLWVRDFNQVATKYKLGKSADAYKLLAALGKLTVEVDALLSKGKVDQMLLNKKYTEFKALGQKYKPDDEGNRVGIMLKARILIGQEKYDEAIPLLDKQIMEAQLEDRQDQLIDLYVERASAAFNAEKYRTAQLDYLRLWLEFEVTGDLFAQAHLNLGYCMRELKDKDWEVRARRHFSWSKGSGIEPYKSKASDELKKMAAPSPNKKSTKKK